MAQTRTVLHRINLELEEGWEAKLQPNGRIYYVNHKTQTSSWLPPRENWQDGSGLPYGWETAMDGHEKPYYINHVEKYTTRDDPRLEPDYVEPPQPRQVELVRDLDKGFGFVAGSEKPVIVRCVTEGGPSVDKLLPGDLILKINGEEVRRAPKDKVIELVRSCRHSITLTVCQPYYDNSNRKSAILTPAKKARLKDNPSRVRFSDAVLVNGASVTSQPSPQESYVYLMPNVLKVFLENGQTKSFKYDNKTTVKDVIHSLQEKLNISCTQHFCLMLQNMKSNIPGKMTLLQEQETLAELAAKPGARHFRCLFRVAFVPQDAYDLLKEDPISFEYFYMQCCNDVVHERFASEMKYDTALRLSALHIQQHAVSNNITGKISIKAIEKETGLEKFVSPSLMENMKNKDLRKMLSQYLKINQNLTAPGQKQLTALQAKLHYMKIVSELKIFGSRVFMVTLLDQKTEAMVLVGPKAGISVVTNIKSYTLTQLADFDQIETIKVTKDAESMHRVDIAVRHDDKVETIGLGLLTEDAQNFVLMVAGYYRIFVDRDRRIVERTVGKNTADPEVPTYEAQHRVLPSQWAYPEDLVSEVVMDPNEENSHDRERQGEESDDRIIDLSQGAPEYEDNEEHAHFRTSNDEESQMVSTSIKGDVLIQTGNTAPTRPDLADIIALAPSLTSLRGNQLSNGGPSHYNTNNAMVKINHQPYQHPQNLSFDEGVTSFGRVPSIEENQQDGHKLTLNGNGKLDEGDSMSLNSSSNSTSSSTQGTSFRVASRGSVASSSTDLTQLYQSRESTEPGLSAAPIQPQQPLSPISLVTFHASPQSRRAQSPFGLALSQKDPDPDVSACASPTSTPSSSSVLELGLNSAGASSSVRLLRSEAEINHQHQYTLNNIPITTAVNAQSNSNNNNANIYGASTVSFGSSSISTDSGFAPTRSFSPDSISSISTSTSTIKESTSDSTKRHSIDGSNKRVLKMQTAPPPPPPAVLSRSSSVETNGSQTSQSLSSSGRSGSQPVTTLLPTSRMNGGGVDLDSDDTDSVGTPNGSPAKGRAKLNRGPSVESALQSFGLHSPDNWPGGADVDFIDIEGLENGGQVTPTETIEAFNPVYSQSGYHSRRQLYLDPDIIDLTNFPPPETPDNDSMLDFTELSNFPPPVFSESNSPTADMAKTDPDLLDVDVDALIAQFTIPPPPTSTVPGMVSDPSVLSTSGSTKRLEQQFSRSGENGNSNPYGSHDDLAHLIIPPPPENSLPTEDMEEISPPPPPSPPPRRTPSSESLSQMHSKGRAPTPPSPPPDSSSSATSLTLNKQEPNKGSTSTAQISRASGRHRRSSSLDINAVRASQSNPLQGSVENIHHDSGKNSPGLSTSTEGITGDSPTTVSQKLHFLLQSLPNFGPEIPPREPRLVRTGSLRMYHRSASVDTNLHQRARQTLSDRPPFSAVPHTHQQSSQSKFAETPQHSQPINQPTLGHQHSITRTPSSSSDKQAMRKTVSTTMPSSSSSPLAASTPVTVFNRSSSLRLDRSTPTGEPSYPRSSSFDTFAWSGSNGLVRSSSETLVPSSSDRSRKQALGSGKSGERSSSNQDKSSPSSNSGGSESFATLKAKLREYRDMLLNKNKSSGSSSKKYALVPSSPSAAHKTENSPVDMTGKKGSLGRSSSLAKLMAQFHRRGSKLSLDSLQDNNWELKEAKPVKQTYFSSPMDSTPSPDQGLSTEPVSSAGDKKSIPVVRDPLGLNRPSLRPVSTNMLNQENVYLTYTYPLRFDPSTSKSQLLEMLSNGEPEQENAIEIDVENGDGSEKISLSQCNSSSNEVVDEGEKYCLQREMGSCSCENNKDDDEESKSRKNGPIKAMQSVLGGGDSNNNENFSNNYNMPDPRMSHSKSSKSHNHQQQKSKSGSSSSKNRKFKDDMSMAHSQSKEKVKANPYATIKMWRPVSNSSGATDGEVYQTFTNFDALRHEPDQGLGFNGSDSTPFMRADGLPPTGDLRNQQQEDFVLKNSRAGVDYHRSSPLRSPRSNPVPPPPKHAVSSSSSTSRQINGFAEIPADYPIDDPGTPERRVSFQDDSRQGGRTKSSTPTPPSRNTSSLSSTISNSSIPPPLPSSPPPSLPNGFSGSRTSPRSSHSRPTTDLSATAPAAMSSVSNPQDDSFQVVSDGTTTSVKLVLSHTYTDVDLAGRDVERLLAELKLTIDSLRTRSASATGTRSSSAKTPGQLGLCLSEFQVQTKAFVQAAKEVVSAANDSREERLLSRLQAAVHALARLFLHGQASMLMLPSASDAQRLGMQLIKATNAFKATLGAAHAAMGKTLTDPHMKYLMRQATNLAALLGGLLGTIKEVQTV